MSNPFGIPLFETSFTAYFLKGFVIEYSKLAYSSMFICIRKSPRENDRLFGIGIFIKIILTLFIKISGIFIATGLVKLPNGI